MKPARDRAEMERTGGRGSETSLKENEGRKKRDPVGGTFCRGLTFQLLSCLCLCLSPGPSQSTVSTPRTPFPHGLLPFHCQAASLCQQTRHKMPAASLHDNSMLMPGPDLRDTCSNKTYKQAKALVQLRNSFHFKKAALAKPQALQNPPPQPPAQSFDALIILLSDQ